MTTADEFKALVDKAEWHSNGLEYFLYPYGEPGLPRMRVDWGLEWGARSSGDDGRYCWRYQIATGTNIHDEMPGEIGENEDSEALRTAKEIFVREMTELGPEYMTFQPYGGV